ncbi:GIY-YIG nuclease family protein [Cyclobacterium plantarum]|uniref:GIY-YIG nuclease family protein n=1 Tax=Cyclobacterium plantarum TaxID=2716263 RepID=UPI003F72B5DD
MIQTNIYNTHNGIGVAYIYIWVSKTFSILYVGMTNNSAGPIGRASGHFNSRGTFRKRFIEEKGIGIEKVEDMILLSFPLPKRQLFISVESSYRESVEYLVQKELQLLRGKLNPSYDVVSWHERFPRRTANSEVKEIASEIVASFESVYNVL